MCLVWMCFKSHGYWLHPLSKSYVQSHPIKYHRVERIYIGLVVKVILNKIRKNGVVQEKRLCLSTKMCVMRWRRRVWFTPCTLHEWMCSVHIFIVLITSIVKISFASVNFSKSFFKKVQSHLQHFFIPSVSIA